MRYDLEIIKREIDSLPKYDNQLYLQGSSKDMDPFQPTIGQNYLIVDKNEISYNIPLFDIPYINNILKENDLVRTRIMKMKPKTCYYWHADKTKRLHIPVYTHAHCFLLVDEDRIHLPADGTAYVVNTTKNHTALNCSKIDRIHIVGAYK